MLTLHVPSSLDSSLEYLFPCLPSQTISLDKPSIRPHANIRPKSNMSKPAKQNQKSTDGGRRGGGKGGTKLRVLREDPPEVRLSKTVTWILQHGAKSEGIFMRPDGAVRVSDLVSLFFVFATPFFVFIRRRRP